ncbi:MAG: sigma-70 family RNA polymerase sigma factor [Planctomycetes bacterium]|nr:sigma-70 family RNA polymerase sigma factor [Planctomycetota bacterium]
MTSDTKAGLDCAGEQELLAGLRAGDETAFETFVRSESPRMLAVARRYTRDDGEARETVQDAFAAALQALDRFEGHARLSTWLHRIVVNTALARARARAGRRELAIEELLPRFTEHGHFFEAPVEWLPDAQIERTELRDLVREAIARLPETFRDVLILRDIEGLDVDAVATRLGLTANAVRIRTHRARQALRTLLDPHFRGDAA